LSGCSHRAVPGGSRAPRSAGAREMPFSGPSGSGRGRLAAESDAEPRRPRSTASVTPSKRPGVVVHQVAGTVRTTRLLVGQGKARTTSRGGAGGPLTQALADDGEDHRVHILHVDGAAAPDAVFAGAGALVWSAGGWCLWCRRCWWACGARRCWCLWCPLLACGGRCGPEKGGRPASPPHPQGRRRGGRAGSRAGLA